ncbi:MAG: H-NS histone family protein [Methylococcales bacterium]|nr:H-NS histone family protein [Methylococcales bacterium]
MKTEDDEPKNKILGSISELSREDLVSVAERFKIEIENREIESKKRAVAEIKAIAEKAGLIVSFADVDFTKRRVGAKLGAKAKIKYRDTVTGNEWSGRGLRPKWIIDAVTDGKNIDDFLTDIFKTD